MKAGGPRNSTNPGKISAPVKTLILTLFDKTSALEKRLTANLFQNPKGDSSINDANKYIFRDILKPLLVDRYTALYFSGQRERCSALCLNTEDEEGKGKKCSFVDEARF